MPSLQSDYEQTAKSINILMPSHSFHELIHKVEFLIYSCLLPFDKSKSKCYAFINKLIDFHVNLSITLQLYQIKTILLLPPDSKHLVFFCISISNFAFKGGVFSRDSLL